MAVLNTHGPFLLHSFTFNFYRIYEITPQARGFPEFPSTMLSAFSALPKSSSLEVIAMALPTIPFGPPESEIKLSIMLMEAIPFSGASTFPKSPPWRRVSLGPPC